MKTPNRTQIEAAGNKLATILGSGVHIRTTDLLFVIDADFPALTSAQLRDARVICAQVADNIRHEALRALWRESA